MISWCMHFSMPTTNVQCLDRTRARTTNSWVVQSVKFWYNGVWRKTPAPPYISDQEFKDKFNNLSTPALDATQDVYRTAEVLTYMGMPFHWPNWMLEKELSQFRATLIETMERVNWSLYTENFVYVPSNFYPYLSECIRRSETFEEDDKFVEELRKTRFAKMCALAYALVVDVHPDRRENLHSRIEAWSGMTIDETAPTMLGALFSAWSQHDAAVVLGNYGAMLAALDPQSSRSALVMSNLLNQMEGRNAEAAESIDFLFDSSQ